MEIFCCQCKRNVAAKLVTGSHVYPHRQDLGNIPFWRCPTCKNYVGCHHKSTNPTRPLGNIPTPELRRLRSEIHAIMDPIWKSGKLPRGAVYAELAKRLGHEFHTAETRTIEEAKNVMSIVSEMASR